MVIHSSIPAWRIPWTEETGGLQSVRVCALSRFSYVRLFATPLTVVTYQAPPSMGFSRQEYWSGLPFPSPGDFANQGSNLGLLHRGQMLYCLSHHNVKYILYECLYIFSFYDNVFILVI